MRSRSRRKEKEHEEQEDEEEEAITVDSDFQSVVNKEYSSLSSSPTSKHSNVHINNETPKQTPPIKTTTTPRPTPAIETQKQALQAIQQQKNYYWQSAIAVH